MARPALLFIGVICTLGLLNACGSTDQSKGWSVEKLFDEAKEASRLGNHAQAVGYYERVENLAAGTLLAQQAQLNKAHTHYLAAEPAQAMVVLDRFLRLHPASPAIDYAMYLKGLVNFNDNTGFLGSLTKRDLSERDQKGARESFETFRDLVERFPESPYSADARKRLVYLVNSLAQYELNIARSYFRQAAYIAAVSRAQIVLEEYRNVPAAEEALYLIMKSYRVLGLNDLAADYLRVMQSNYPQSIWLTRL